MDIIVRIKNGKTLIIVQKFRRGLLISRFHFSFGTNLPRALLFFVKDFTHYLKLNFSLKQGLWSVNWLALKSTCSILCDLCWRDSTWSLLCFIGLLRFLRFMTRKKSNCFWRWSVIRSLFKIQSTLRHSKRLSFNLIWGVSLFYLRVRIVTVNLHY